jgi:chromate transporter
VLLWDLFIAFAKVGAFTLGGGYAMVPIIQSEVVDKREWINKDEFIDILAVAQSTPGALAINMATFIGYKKKGILGAATATLGCVAPSFICILIIAMFFAKFMDRDIVKRAFMGIRPAVAALIAFSVFKIGKSSKIKGLWYGVGIIALVLVLFFNTDPILIIIASALFGGVFGRRGEKVDN